MTRPRDAIDAELIAGLYGELRSLDKVASALAPYIGYRPSSKTVASRLGDLGVAIQKRGGSHQ